MIYCSIDLMDGKAVQLVQGKAENKKVEVDNIFDLATKFSQIGPINVIDLDAAFSKGNNQAIITHLAKHFIIRVGGGIRSIEQAQYYIEQGVQKIIIGSKAFDPNFLTTLLSTIPKEKIIIALDSFKDNIVIHGWQETTSLRPENLLKSLEPFCSEFLYTQVEKEGLMQGPDFQRLKTLRQLTCLPLIAAGGISSLSDISLLHQENIDCVLGMALYTNNISFQDLKGLCPFTLPKD